MPQPRVQSLERALDLLEALAGADELGVSEIAAQTGLVPSTAHRLLGTLVARGYASQSPTTGRYLLGYKLLELTSGVQDRLERLRTAARPHLEAIQSETGETTNLVVLEGRDVGLHRVGLRDAQRAPVHRDRAARSPRTRPARARRCWPGATPPTSRRCSTAHRWRPPRRAR